MLGELEDSSYRFAALALPSNELTAAKRPPLQIPLIVLATIAFFYFAGFVVLPSDGVAEAAQPAKSRVRERVEHVFGTMTMSLRELFRLHVESLAQFAPKTVATLR